MFKEKSEEIFDYIEDVIRKIYENPEDTIKLIKEELDKMGIRHDQVINGGLLGFIEGDQEDDNPKTILLRAKPDDHIAMALATAKILSESKDDFAGNIILCFEKGEELEEGYKYILAYLDKNDISVDAAYGIHLSDEYESGVMAIRDGGINAGTMVFDVTIKGQSRHGASLNLANNPLECFVDIYQSMKSLRVDKFSPFDPLIYSIDLVEMGEKNDQTQDRLRFKGRAKFFDRDKVGYKFYSLLRSVIINKARDNGCKVSFKEFTRPHFPIINDKALADLARKSMADEIGSEFIKEANPSMESDSFSAYNAIWPGLYIMLGIRNDELSSGATLHSDEPKLGETALKNGLRATASFVIDYLKSDLKIEDRPFKDNLETFFREESRTREEIEEIYETIS